TAAGLLERVFHRAAEPLQQLQGRDPNFREEGVDVTGNEKPDLHRHVPHARPPSGTRSQGFPRQGYGARKLAGSGKSKCPFCRASGPIAPAAVPVADLNCVGLMQLVCHDSPACPIANFARVARGSEWMAW